MSGAGLRAAPANALALLVLAVALAHGLLALGAWTATGAVPGARELLDPWPLALLAVLGAAALAGLLRRSPPPALALAGLAWSFAVEACTQLPPYPAAEWAGDGPVLIPLHLALGLLTALWALGLPSRGPGAGERACALLILWTTCGFKAYTRTGEAVYALFAAAVVLVLACHARPARLRAALLGPGRPAALAVAAMLLWWLFAAWVGDSPRIGLDLWTRLAAGALFALALAAALDSVGVGRAAGALPLGLVLGLVALGLVVGEMAPYHESARLAAWRLRLFDLHANQIGPFFALGVALVLPALLARRRLGGLPVPLLAAIALLSLVALAWTRSRSSAVGLGAGVLAAALAHAGRLPRRPLRALGIGAGLAAVLLAVLASPLGSGLWDRLEGAVHGQSSIGQRYHFWKMAWASMLEDPLTGLGPGQYYAHTLHAEPSFYDGTIQALHPHNILLAAGESAGFPGLLLFALFCLVVLEALRRRVLASRGEERVLYAGLLGAVCAVLGANLLDLGQSQNTFVPVLVWIALGLAGAGAGAAPAPAASAARGRLGWPAALGAAGLLLLLAVRPLAGGALIDAGRNLLTGARPEAALARYELARRVDPLNDRATRGLGNVHRLLGHEQRHLALLKAECESAPRRARSWFQYGRELLRHDRPEEALAALARAAALDPRGPDVADVAFARAWAYLQLGRADAARAQLLEGLRIPHGSWGFVPTVQLPPEPGDPPGSRRTGFELQGGSGGVIPFDEILAELGRECLALADVDEVRARRILGTVVAGYRSQGRPDEALALTRAYRQGVPERIGSTQLLELQLLGDRGDHADAAALYEASAYREDPHVTAAVVIALLESDDPALLARAQALRGRMDRGDTKDVFFTAGESAQLFSALAELALLRGELDEAFRYLGMALYDRGAVPERVAAAQRFTERVAELELGNEALLRALGELLRQSSLSRKAAADARRLRAVAQTLLAAWRGPRAKLFAAVDGALAGTGPAGETFRAELQALAGGRGRPSGTGRR